MDAAMEEHHKAGCNEASEAKYMESAKVNPDSGAVREVRNPMQERRER